MEFDIFYSTLIILLICEIPQSSRITSRVESLLRRSFNSIQLWDVVDIMKTTQLWWMRKLWGKNYQTMEINLTRRTLASWNLSPKKNLSQSPVFGWACWGRLSAGYNFKALFLLVSNYKHIFWAFIAKTQTHPQLNIFRSDGLLRGCS